ncbi:hypothetical protein GWI33_020125 [Rhynchophorus ferrugineus]|uniref:Uncharacterized protein n=1 Tax=Rhynchophorus ferrugineus TaxID=354439 RepID=A0A834M3Q3_RHYFE|nr:hypothetical protein GWI33_020125 [Rhynchophorus ferrugineus]
MFIDIGKTPKWNIHRPEVLAEYTAEPDCLRFGPKGCVKCTLLIVYPTRRCVDQCPFGYYPTWSNKADFMGQMCFHNGNFLGMSAHRLTIFVGVVSGIVISVLIVFIAVIYIKYRKKSFPQVSDTTSETDDTPERRDFLKQLETLKPYAQSYLDMLNDTRHQIRQLHLDGDNSAISAYKPVVRDLAKILLLLNRPIDNISIPDDWEHLFSWAEKTLKRYKRMSDNSQPQVAQLIDFLQTSSELDDHDYSVRGSITMSTFRPFGSSDSLQNANNKAFSSNFDSCHAQLKPEWKFEYSLVGNSSEFNPIAWKSSRDILGGPLFLDEDFYDLGLRPQDEITTEL